MVHTTGAYPGFQSMERLEVNIATPLGCGASLSQVTPQHFVRLP